MYLETPPFWQSLLGRRRWTASLHKASHWGQTPLAGRPTRDPIRTGWERRSPTLSANGAEAEASPAEETSFGAECPSTPACGALRVEKTPVWLGAPRRSTPCCLEICWVESPCRVAPWHTNNQPTLPLANGGRRSGEKGNKNSNKCGDNQYDFNFSELWMVNQKGRVTTTDCRLRAFGSAFFFFFFFGLVYCCWVSKTFNLLLIFLKWDISKQAERKQYKEKVAVFRCFPTTKTFCVKRF